MRAVISCNTDLNNEQIKSVLNGIKWLVNEELTEKIDIFGVNNDINKENVNTGPFCVVYDRETKTWGSVTRENYNRLVFKLKNPFPYRLKRACESLVILLRSETSKKIILMQNNSPYIFLKKKFKKNITVIMRFFSFQYINNHETDSLFEFLPTIHMLEKDNKHDSFSGKILDHDLLKAAASQKNKEMWLMLIGGITTILMYYLTSPVCTEIFNGEGSLNWALSKEWGSWLVSIFDGLGSATLVTFSLSFFEIIFHKRYLQKQAPIIWFEKNFYEEVS